METRRRFFQHGRGQARSVPGTFLACLRHHVRSPRVLLLFHPHHPPVPPPDPLVETLSLDLPSPTTLSYTYSTPCSVPAFSCNVNNCHHQHSFLFHYFTYPC